MNQRIPEINLEPFDGPMVCDICHEESKFLVGLVQEGRDKNHCTACFSKKRPEYRDAVADFADLLDMLIEIKDRHMTLDEMHELYGESQDDSD